MTRHPSGDGMDGKAHPHPLLGQLFGHLAHRMLGLGDGQAIARHDDHRAGVGEDERAIVGAACIVRFVAVHGLAIFTAEATQNNADERAVHAFAHDVAQDGTGRANQRSDND